MARIAGVDLPRNKRMEIALTYIYGIGKTRSRQILGRLAEQQKLAPIHVSIGPDGAFVYG